MSEPMASNSPGAVPSLVEPGEAPAAMFAGSGAAGDETFGVDDAPVGEFRRGRDIGAAFDERGGIERAEKARAREIVADHLGDFGRHAAFAGRGGAEIGDGDGQRLHRALIDADADGVLRGGGESAGAGGRDQRGGEKAEGGLQHDVS